MGPTRLRTVYRDDSSAALRKTDSSIGAVSFPVFVFWRLG